MTTNLADDKRIVLTLDAGGTNFVFTAIQGNREVVSPVTLPSNASQLHLCIATLEEGFKAVISKLKSKPVAISFAFPGPSDYDTGIIGKLNNLPAFQGGIPLRSILRNLFNIPVFINNDGNLYAYGEALSGFLPYVNNLLSDAGLQKQYRNLIGLTLGTGFGGGIVNNGQLLVGDNSMAAEVWILSNRVRPMAYAEEGISIRAVRRVYAETGGSFSSDSPTPKEIFDIANGKNDGNRQAALKAFGELGKVLGDVVGNLISVIDGPVVIGGGLSGAMPLIFPSMLEELESQFSDYNHHHYPRMVQKVFNLDNENSLRKFIDWPQRTVEVPGLDEKLKYFEEARIPIGTSKIGTSKAIAMGAYAYALKMLG